MRRSLRARPGIEDLEGRSLLTTVVAPSPATVLASTALGTWTHSGSYLLANGVYTGGNLAETQDSNDPYADSTATLSCAGTNSLDGYGISFFTDAYTDGQYGTASAKEVTSGTGNPNDTGSLIPIQIQANTWAGEQNGDPVQVTLSGRYSTIDGSTPPKGGENDYQIGYNLTGAASDFQYLLVGKDTAPGVTPPQSNTVSFDTTIGSTFYVGLEAVSYALEGQGNAANTINQELDLTITTTDLPTSGGGGGSTGGGGGGGGGPVGGPTGGEGGGSGGGSTGGGGVVVSPPNGNSGSPSDGNSGGLTPAELALLLLSLDSPSTGGGSTAQPHVASISAGAHAHHKVATITVTFDDAMNAASVDDGGYYTVRLAAKRRGHPVSRKSVAVAVSYDSNAHVATLSLAKPVKGPLEVTVSSGIMAADGEATGQDATQVVD